MHADGRRWFGGILGAHRCMWSCTQVVEALAVVEVGVREGVVKVPVRRGGKATAVAPVGGVMEEDWVWEQLEAAA